MEKKWFEGSVSISCNECVCYVPADFMAKDDKISINYNKPSDGTGECRRNPPVLIKAEINGCIIEYFGFTWIIQHTDFPSWCGEFYPKGRKITLSPPPPIEE